MIVTSFKDQRFKSSHPLCGGEFHELLERSLSACAATGWMPLHFIQNKSLLPGYVKSHSYGEFIFDWAWANFYHQNGFDYYPKLVHSLPFSPINAPKTLGDLEAFRHLAHESFDFYQQDSTLTGEHYLFTSKEENDTLTSMGFILMETLQFHWKNSYQNFSHFLETLTTNKRKMIQKERRRVEDYKLDIKEMSCKELSEEQMQEIYDLYLTTIDKKESQAYLNLAFFKMLPQFLGDETFILGAFENNELIAMSLFFHSQDALYGRYWGIHPEVEEKYRLLHFELCYYRGMDYCIKHKIPLFEAGAQGEQKLWRGFAPVVITSAHHLKHPQLFSPIKHYVIDQNHKNQEMINYYRGLLPFK